MKPKLIFWIDSNFYYFGLAKSLQEMLDCELYSIIEITDKPKKFFKKQQIVNFKKIWFYHDYIKNTNQKPDLKYLQSIEKKYGINLWLIAFNDRMFNDVNEYYKFSADEILLILEQECKLFEKILDEIKPDFLLMPPTHQQHNHIFYEICKARGIHVLISAQTRLGFRLLISDKMDKMRPLPPLSDFKGEDCNIDPEKYVSVWNAYNKIFSDKFVTGKKKLAKAAASYLFSDNSNIKTHYSYYGRNKTKVLFKTISYRLKYRIRESFMNKNLNLSVKTKSPFIYFPLTQEIERALFLGAPFYLDQFTLIKNVAKSLPIGYKLVVKDHPQMKHRGWRSVSEMKKIMDIPSVELVHPLSNSVELIKKSSLVFTINGSTSIEAAIYQKPSIILEDTGQFELPSMHKVNSLKELPTAIRTCLDKKVDTNDVVRYIKTIEKNSIAFEDQEILLRYLNLFHDSGYLANKELPVEKVKSFLEEYKTNFDDFAAFHIKVINKHLKDNEFSTSIAVK
tara:strand:- start:1137 stop:2660 length:1524 start_codon:yes stop_codon:yes gene_type:complete